MNFSARRALRSFRYTISTEIGDDNGRTESTLHGRECKAERAHSRCSRQTSHRIVEAMEAQAPLLQGKLVRLEPLEYRHINGLVSASAADSSLYRWSPVPHGKAAVSAYVETALSWQGSGSAVPLAIVRVEDAAVVGSTRFWNLEQWAWPQGHPAHGRTAPDACEIGYTWLAPAAIRTGVNTEAKLLMLTHAFETWRVLRVCFHTDARNQRSRGALERIGAQFEGILRAHRMAADYIARDSARFSIVAAEWPEVKRRLLAFANRR